MNIDMENTKKAGFSLIEVLVVMGILGVVTAVAIPSYRAYVIKANIVKTRGIMDAIREAAKIKYIEDSTFKGGIRLFDTNLNDMAGDFSKGHWLNISGAGGVYWDGYDDSAYYCVSVLKLKGIDDYVEPTSSKAFTDRARYCEMLLPSQGVFSTTCGIHAAGSGFSPGDIPSEFLFKGCTCSPYNDKNNPMPSTCS